ncbi:hypothetical protein [Sphingobacterium siyangense]|uniref:hypothetical protein n=1 Tax=Sphingobacterium siyangense TaxID=459529 RepID=UPI0019639330|nr:hypothetical protein [Sphingobacterium siyangense]QRY60507.1 hypothetical protein JVX97_14075 [Sphingobacterium siyangense]
MKNTKIISKKNTSRQVNYIDNQSHELKNCLNSSSAHCPINALDKIQNTYLYAYIRVEGKFISKKLKVKVDLGDSDEQITEGEKLSEVLTNKKSYASILNYMSKIGYELLQTKN